MKMTRYAVGDVVRIKSGIFEGDTFIVTEGNSLMSTGRISIPRYAHKGYQFYETDLEPVYYYHFLQFAREAYAVRYHEEVTLPDNLPAKKHRRILTMCILRSTHVLTAEEQQQVEATLALAKRTTIIAWNNDRI